MQWVWSSSKVRHQQTSIDCSYGGASRLRLYGNGPTDFGSVAVQLLLQESKDISIRIVRVGVWSFAIRSHQRRRPSFDYQHDGADECRHVNNCIGQMTTLMTSTSPTANSLSYFCPPILSPNRLLTPWYRCFAINRETCHFNQVPSVSIHQLVSCVVLCVQFVCPMMSSIICDSSLSSSLHDHGTFLCDYLSVFVCLSSRLLSSLFKTRAHTQ